MTKTCKNCGHDEWEHTYKAKWSRCMYGNGKLCKCKKFEAEKKKPFDDAVKIILGEEQKGCGKGYRYFNGANWQKMDYAQSANLKIIVRSILVIIIMIV